MNTSSNSLLTYIKARTDKKGKKLTASTAASRVEEAPPPRDMERTEGLP
jgi:hypothetical protein